jgi:nucleoid DNA-binding protein
MLHVKGVDMNRVQLADMTHEKVEALGVEISRKQVHAVVNVLFDADGGTILDCLKSEDAKLSLTKFGSFSITELPPRTGRNPRTGETIEIPAKRKIKFSPSGMLLEKLGK